MISLNSVFKYENGERMRIIEIIEPFAYLVNIDAATSMPKKELITTIEDELESEKLIQIKDPFSRMIEDKELSKIQIEKRDRDWEFVTKYIVLYKAELLEKNNRTNKLEDISKQSGVSLTKVKKTLSRYWQRGMNKNALLPDYINSGGKGKEKKLSDSKVGRPKRVDYNGEVIEGINITEDVKRHFNFAINKYYRSKTKISLKEAYTLMLRDFYSDPYKEAGELKYRVWDNGRIPTYDQFYYWFRKNQDVKMDISFRESEKEFNLKERSLLSNSAIETDGPGTRFQVDATIGDIYLVSSLNRSRIIGRPVIYALIDVYSRLITGVYVGLEGPSWLGAMMALDNMLADKVQFCKSYGIEISEEQWPAKHLPDIIIADRGEFEGYSPENLINNLNVRLENTSPYRGDLKGIVERNFRTVNGKIKHKTPGAILKEYRKRGDRDYRLDATLTLDEFTRIFINMVLHHNSKIVDKYPMEKEMLRDELVPSPINLWNWGIENKKGRLKTVDREVLRLNLLPKGNASISRAGIRFKGLYYSSDRAIREQWFIKPSKRSVEVVYDPRNVQKIFIPYNNGLEYEECYLTDKSVQYKSCILEELMFNEELLAELKGEKLQQNNQLNVDLEEEIEKIVKEAKRKKAEEVTYEDSNAKKIRGIRNNRAVEKEINREKEVFKFGEDTVKADRIAEVIELPKHEDKNVDKEPSAKDKLMDKLRKKREEKRES
ncbi:hypothetical protein CSC2_43350 [Clostridium zeae]|uniref:Integrase catalytic domain-containing protein n=1 Tax=Clostridium zeae TaxID=2759022 RepID=A0ABQ1EGN5_9CLOT|nr:Mu transposase C-terminal domain-containing protein [Clostridium zeae]GFZ33809.1 hypothetical protein CSC2_43350 [Clostridium zeae]